MMGCTHDGLWKKLIRDARRALGLTKAEVAVAAKVDTSYVVLMEREGFVPRRDKVMAMARALHVNEDTALLVAGYAPMSISPAQVMEVLGEARDGERGGVPDMSLMDPDLREAFRTLRQLGGAGQRQWARAILKWVAKKRAGGDPAISLLEV